MAEFTLLPHVHAAALGQDLVLLDVRADAYLCVRGGVQALRPDARARVLRPEAASTADALLAGGLVSPGSSPAGSEAHPPAPPRRGFPRDGGCGGRPLDALRLALALLDVATQYPGRPLGEVLTAAERGRRNPGSQRPADVFRLARIFDAWAIWLPAPRKCLVRSFLLLRFLQRSGCGADWVFGVRTWPFGAHCWLQLDDVVLDDAPERLAAYEPILAVKG